jgi:3-oxoacyl-[acyl-carrier protein] reductase
MLLEQKTAVIYGAGAIGGTVARTFAGEGARVFLAGRSLPPLHAVV